VLGNCATPRYPVDVMRTHALETINLSLKGLRPGTQSRYLKQQKANSVDPRVGRIILRVFSEEGSG
jgi:hypothetical protein